jgi:hypothetical protein
MKTNDNINYEAEKGMVFIRKSDNKVMGFGLGLGASDSIENYYEADCPEEYKGIEGYDNTIDEQENEFDNEGNILPNLNSRFVS